MANTMLSGKITKMITAERVNTANGPRDKVVFDLCVSREGAGERVALLQEGKKYLCDFYRCTIWGDKAVNFHRLCNGQAGRIVHITGNLLQSEWVREDAPICIDRQNPMYGLIQAHGNQSMGISYDNQKDCFWIKGDHVEKQINVTVHTFNLLDNPNQQSTGFGVSNGGNGNGNSGGFGSQNNNGGGFGGQNNGNFNGGFGGQTSNNGGFGGQTSGNGGFGGGSSNSNGGFGGQSNGNGFGGSSDSGNIGFGGQSNGNGFGVENGGSQEENMAGFGGQSSAPAGFGGRTNEQAPATGGVETNINTEFTPSGESTGQEF